MVDTSKGKKQDNSIILIIISIVLFISSIGELTLATEYLNYKKNQHSKIDGCIDKTEQSDYNSMEKVNMKKDESANNKHIVTGKPQYSDGTITSNIIFGTILLIVSILLFISGILTMNGKEFMQGIHSKTGLKILLFVSSIVMLTISISIGVLINKYQNDKYETERIIATCVRLKDLNSEEDIKKAFALRANLPKSEKNITMIFNTAIAVILGLSSVVLFVMGIFGFREKKKTRISGISTINRYVV